MFLSPNQNYFTHCSKLKALPPGDVPVSPGLGTIEMSLERLTFKISQPPMITITRDITKYKITPIKTRSTIGFS